MSISLLKMFSSCGAGGDGPGGGAVALALGAGVPVSRPLARSPRWAGPGFGQVFALGLGSPCFCWEKRAVCTQLFNTCTPYFGEFLLGFVLGGSLECACPPSFPYGSCHLLMGMSGPKFVNTGCVKRKEKPQTNNKKRGEKKVQREQLLAFSPVHLANTVI